MRLPCMQFTVRGLMIAVAVAAAYCLAVRSLPGFFEGEFESVLRHAYRCLTGQALAFLAAWGVTESLGFRPRREARSGWLVRGALLVAVALYLIWAQRLVCWGDIFDLDWGRGLPRPDAAILALEAWYEARHPLRAPGTIKMHGEFPRVEHALSELALAACALSGAAVGLAGPVRWLRRGWSEATVRPTYEFDADADATPPRPAVRRGPRWAGPVAVSAFEAAWLAGTAWGCRVDWSIYQAIPDWAWSAFCVALPVAWVTLPLVGISARIWPWAGGRTASCWYAVQCSWFLAYPLALASAWG